MDRRALASTTLGVLGFAAGVAAAVASAPLLGVVAGLLALAAAGVVLPAAAEVRTSKEAVAEMQHGLASLEGEITRLHQEAAAGKEAVSVAEAFTEMVSVHSLQVTGIATAGLLDQPSGLLDGRYFRAALDGRLATARRHLRPVSLVLLQLDPGDMAPAAREAAVASFGEVLTRTLREADTACLVDDGRFAVILEDTSEGGGVWAAERIRRALAGDGGRVQALSAGVASYPTHALDADELLDRATTALIRARSGGRGLVEVAPVE
jgi:diguanylate cyclase (GGDEF)-like protein